MTRYVVLAAGFLTVLLAGCGLIPVAAPSAGSLIVAAPTRPPTLIHAVGIIPAPRATPSPTASTVYRVALTGQGPDTIHDQVTRWGTQGRLTVTAAGNRLLLSLSDVGSSWVLRFGRRHLPVLVTQSTSCGSGGCTYMAYTWDAARQRFVAVVTPSAKGYRYHPASGQYQQVAIPWLQQGLFGFGQPTRAGLSVTSRLYDFWNHVSTQRYAYAVNGVPGGALVPVGVPTYAPRQVPPGILPLLAMPVNTFLALLEARGLGLWPQGRAVLYGSGAKAAWDRLRPLEAFGTSLAPTSSPRVVEVGHHAQVTATVTGVTGPTDQRLQAFYVSVSLRQVGRTWLVVHARLSPEPLKVASVAAVLKRLGVSRQTRGRLRRMSETIVVQPPTGGLDWQVAWAGRQPGSWTPWVGVNAATGTISQLGT